MSFLSSSDQHFAFMGESGIQKRTKKPQNTVAIPYIMKRAYHGLIGEVDRTKKKANARSPPRIYWIPFIIYLKSRNISTQRSMR